MRGVALGKLPAKARKRIDALLRTQQDLPPAEEVEHQPPDPTEARMFAQALGRGQRGLPRMEGVVATPIPCERCKKDTRDFWAYIGRGGICRRVCVGCASAEFEEQGGDA